MLLFTIYSFDGGTRRKKEKFVKIIYVTLFFFLTTDLISVKDYAGLD